MGPSICFKRKEIFKFTYPGGSFNIMFIDNRGEVEMGTQHWEITRNGLWNINYQITHGNEVLAYARYPITERKGFLNLQDGTELSMVIRQDLNVDFLNQKSEFYARIEPDSSWQPVIHYGEDIPLRHVKCIAVLSMMMYFEMSTDTN
jgi:hypothetical protein